MPRIPQPPSPPKNIDDQLQSYLENAQKDRKDGNTIANLRIEVYQLTRNFVRIERKYTALENRVDDLETEMVQLRADRNVDTQRVARHGSILRTVEGRLDIEGDGLDTGSFHVEDLQKALKEQLDARELLEKRKILERQDEEKLWWKRSRIAWIAGALAWAATAGLPWAFFRMFGGGH